MKKLLVEVKMLPGEYKMATLSRGISKLPLSWGVLFLYAREPFPCYEGGDKGPLSFFMPVIFLNVEDVCGEACSFCALSANKVDMARFSFHG